MSSDVRHSDARASTRVVVVMGVAASGKTLIGTELARRLRWAFADADDAHSAANLAKMRSGTPLTDADRAPWLERLRRRVVEHLTTGTSLVLACSALKAAYRDALAAGDDRVVFLHLEAPREVLAERLAARSDHWFAPGLLDSQLATLEEPSEAARIRSDRPVEDVVTAALEALQARLPG